jgi:hypothetical protein
MARIRISMNPNIPPISKALVFRSTPYKPRGGQAGFAIVSAIRKKESSCQETGCYNHDH